MSSVGPAGERGKTGDHGQHGDVGPIGATGDTGETGETGETGQRGRPGIQGPPGLRGRALTWVQALAMFLLILVVGVVLSFSLERQQSRLEAQQRVLAQQQAAINDNSRKIAEERYKGCLGGVQIIRQLNAWKLALIEVEKKSKDPLAKERIRAHQKGLIVLPDEACHR